MKHYQLTPNGMVTVQLQGEITISCVMNFTHYPFDQQMCYLQAVPNESRGNVSVQSRLMIKRHDGIQRDLQYTVVNTTNLGPIDNVMKPTQGMTVRIDLRRHLTSYMTETFAPTFIMVLVSWISLLMPPEIIPGRAGLLITLTLVVTNISLNLTRTSPRSSQMNQLFVWVYACFGMIFATLCEYAFILFFMRKSSVPLSKKILCGRRKACKTDKEPKMAFDQFSKTVDTWTLIILAITFTIFNVCFWTENIARLNQPFSENNTYLQKAAYPLRLRNEIQRLVKKDKPKDCDAFRARKGICSTKEYSRGKDWCKCGTGTQW